MYSLGRSISGDDSEEVEWIRENSLQGYEVLGFNLGLCVHLLVERGLMAPIEDEEQGTPYKLGVMYSKGRGVAQDYVVAYMWINISAAYGAENGAELRDAIAERMTSEQIAKAQELASKYVKGDFKDCP